MPTTQDYLDLIRQRRESRQSVSVDFGALPKDVDHDAIARELGTDLAPEYHSVIGTRLKERRPIELDYAQAMPHPSTLREAAELGVDAIRKPLEAAGRKVGEVIPPLTQTRIPGAAELQELKERAPGMAAETVAEDFAKRGVPGAAAIGAAVGVPLIALDLATPIPKTLGDAAMMLGTLGLLKGAASAGSRLPILGEELGTLPNRIRRAFGFPEVGEVIPPEPGFKRAPEPAPEDLTPAALLEHYKNQHVESTLKELGPRPAITPQEIAARAAAQGTEAQAPAPLVNVTAALTDQADVAPLLRPAIERAKGQIRQALGVPPDASLTPADVQQAVSANIVPLPEAMRLEKQIFDEEALSRRIDPRQLGAARELAGKAAAAPGEVLTAPATEALKADHQALQEALARRQPQEAPKTGPGAAEPAVGDSPAAEPAQGQPPKPQGAADVVLPGAEKPVRQMSPTEFVESVQRQAEIHGEDVSAVDALQMHRSVLEADAIEPEHGDLSFNPEQLEAPAAAPASPLASMTPEDFARKFPGAPPELHKAAVRNALAAGHDVPEASLKAYPEIARDVELEAQDQLEQSLAGQAPESAQLLKFVRDIGINIEEAKKAGYMGELEEARGRGVFRRRGGMSIGQLTEAAAEARIIPSADERVFFDRLSDELRKTSAVFQMREGITYGGGDTSGEARRSDETSPPARASESPPPGDEAAARIRKGLSSRVPSSISSRPVFVKALEDALPALIEEAAKTGGDPTDSAFVVDAFRRWHSRMHEVLREVQEETKAKTLTPEKYSVLSAEMDQLGAKETAVTRLANILIGPEEWTEFYERKDAGGDASRPKDEAMYSKKFLPPGDVGEASIAFGNQDLQQLAKEAADDVAKAGPQLDLPLAGSGLPQEIRRTGAANFIGAPASNVKQVAEIVAALRHPKFEHFQVVFVKAGKVVGHQAYTSGLPAAVRLPQSTMAEIAETAEKLEADQVYYAHNHPSGNPTPSSEDRQVTIKAKEWFGDKFTGHLVLNGEEFVLIEPDGRSSRQKYLRPKKSFISADQPQIDTPGEAARLAKQHSDGKTTVVLALGARGHVLAVELVPQGADLRQFVIERGRNHGAAQIVVVHPQGTKVPQGTGYKRLPAEVVDVIELRDDGTVESSHAIGELSKYRGPLSIFPEGHSDSPLRVAEEKTYSVDPGKLKQVLERKKIAVGSEVTLRRAVTEPSVGAIPRGRKGKVAGVDLEGGHLLVVFGDELIQVPVMVSSQQLVETYVEPPKPPRPTEVKRQVQDVTGIAKGEKVGLTEQDLLKLRLSSEARGAQLGARAAARQARATIVKEFQEKLLDAREAARQSRVEAEGQARWREAAINDIRAKVVEFAEKNLPLAARGKWLTAVRDAQTPRDLARAFARVDMEVKQLHRKGLISDLRKVVSRALDSGRVAPEYKAKIEQLVAGFELQGHTKEKLERLAEVRAFIDREKAAGKPIDLPASLLDEVEILSRRPLNQISNEDLERLLEKARLMEDMGRKLAFNRDTYYKLVKDRLKRDVVAAVVPIEKNPKVQPKPGELLDLKGRINNAVAYSRDFLNNLDRAIMSMDAFFDMIDGGAGFEGANYRTFKQTLDDRFADYLSQRDRWIEPVRELVKELKLTDQNMERIGLYAIRHQEGGLRHLVNNGYSMNEVKEVKLTDAERQVYEKMREAIEEPFPRVQKLMAELYNQRVRKVQNYFPFQTDWKRLSDFEVVERLGDAFQGLKNRTKSVEQGFTRSRIGGRQPIKLHALDIFQKHMDDVAYLLSMQRDVKMLTEIAKSPEYRAAAGDVGSGIVIDWLDLMARKGGAGRLAVNSVLGVSMEDALTMLRRNVGAAALGLKVTSILVQPAALMDGMAIVGGPQVLLGMERVLTDRAWRKFLLDNIPELKARAGDDPAFLDLSLNRRIARAQSASLAALQQLDQITAASVAAGAYQKSLDQQGKTLNLEVPDPKALQEAARAMRISQGSPFFKDVSLALSRGRLSGIRAIDKAFLQFKGFSLNRWTNLRYTLPEKWRQGDPADAALGYAYYTLANAAETGIRIAWKAALVAIFGGLLPDWDDFEGEFLKQALQNVPFVSDYLSWSKYHSVPMPAADAVLDLAEGSYKAATARKNRDQVHAIIQALEGAARMAGVPGTAQVSELVRAAINSRRLIFPWHDDLLELQDRAKEQRLTQDEAVRLEILKAAQRDFNGLNKDYKGAMERGDTALARRLSQKTTEVLDIYRRKLKGR